jgi:putative hydrolase of the HAD superfamily
VTAAKPRPCILFDWGDTLMRVFPELEGPMASWPRVEVVSGVRQALGELRSAWTIGLATNAADSAEAEIRSALERGGLNGLIDRVFCQRTIGLRKSDPEYFDHVIDSLGLTPHQVVMIGDDFEGDVLAANRAGIRAVWFNEDGSEDRTNSMHRTIRDLRELQRVLDAFIG